MVCKTQLQRVILHIRNVLTFLDFCPGTECFFRAFASVFFILYINSSANAQIYVDGDAYTVDTDKTPSSAQKSGNVKNKIAVIYINEGAFIYNSTENSNLKVEKKTAGIAPVRKKTKDVLKTSLTVKKRVAKHTKKDFSLKKSAIHCKPINDPDQFISFKYQCKIFNLPTEHFPKILVATEQLFIFYSDFSFEKRDVPAIDFSTVHAFNSIFFTRPPPAEV